MQWTQAPVNQHEAITTWDRTYVFSVPANTYREVVKQIPKKLLVYTRLVKLPSFGILRERGGGVRSVWLTEENTFTSWYISLFWRDSVANSVREQDLVLEPLLHHQPTFHCNKFHYSRQSNVPSCNNCHYVANKFHPRQCIGAGAIELAGARAPKFLAAGARGHNRIMGHTRSAGNFYHCHVIPCPQRLLVHHCSYLIFLDLLQSWIKMHVYPHLESK